MTQVIEEMKETTKNVDELTKDDAALTLDSVTYAYRDGKKRDVLKNVSASFARGKLYSVMGKSGAGKSTLLSLISGLDVPTSGTVSYDGVDLTKMNRDDYRAKSIGVIFQAYNLLTNATVIDNMVLSMKISGVKGKKKELAYELLEKVGIDREKASRKVLKLSGGEQQRVGIARALAHNPDVVIADEPTGNLDAETGQQVMEIFQKLAHEDGKCVILVTHSNQVARATDETQQLTSGRLSTPKKNRSAA
ncbi:MAG: ABC transporter ATP-binding protein [Propionibacteriaceae bacterium]|jgi:putative ABC transport system ATP-binding protein|nr:ABC transporter ATP-binding protein [Propionibacteriaceae bacterium]